MTQAVAVLREGHAYQARLFWRNAAHLLDPEGGVVRVAFETGPKGFDDIWVEYAPGRGPRDGQGRLLSREHLQCKWHVMANDFTHADLVDPDFINAKSYSFLQRAWNAHRESVQTGGTAQFGLLTNWTIQKADPLAQLVIQRTSGLRIDDLFQGTTSRSRYQRIRQLWCEHLGIDECELRELTASLAFKTDPTSLDDHRALLDSIFELRGLARIPASESSFKYDDIVFAWLGQGRIEFDKNTFRDACASEGLLQAPKKRSFFGVKTFEHPYDRLEARCTKVLNLTSFFNDRAILDPSSWKEALLPQLRSFLTSAARETETLGLALDVHATMAFAAGSILDIKSGRHVQLEQRTLSRLIWSADDAPSDPSWARFRFDHDDTTTADELVVAVSVTHNVLGDVHKQLADSSAAQPELVHAVLQPNPGATAVTCGRHAFELAEALTQEIQRLRSLKSHRQVHLYVAAPNVFTFMLGQRASALAPVTLYEFDFGGTRTYRASLRLG